MAPSRLEITTSSVLRLLKEEASYHKELEQQRKRIESIEKSEDKDENTEYELRQERRALEETHAVFPSLHKKIAESAEQLKSELAAEEVNQSETRAEEISRAQEALVRAASLLKSVGHE